MSTGYSQNEDHMWMIGSHSTHNLSPFREGINVFNFNQDPVSITESDSIKVAFNWTCSLLCSADGDLKYISNGMHILDEDYLPIKGGEVINKNNYWDLWESTYADGTPMFGGLRLVQGMLMLPWPKRDSVLFLTYNRRYNPPNTSYSKGLYFGIIDHKVGSVVFKDSLVVLDSLDATALQACLHGNGRDWWVVAPGFHHDKYYTFLLEPSGFSLKHVQDAPSNYPKSIGQASFSPDGSKYALFQVEASFSTFNRGHLSVFDFDRCTGLFSEMQYFPMNGATIVVGCAFSEDGRYLYISNHKLLSQLDMEANDLFSSIRTVAASDGFESVYNEQYSVENDFYTMARAPDGRIYISGGNTLHWHRIEYPDERDKDCQVNQHSIEVVNNITTMPNFPNFRLGPLDNSTCDTLGHNNYPIAKFRYEQDTADHLNIRFTDLSYFRPEEWEWDFDDGETFEGRKPYWHTFPEPGNYEVCLTVANENGEDTNCRIIHIGDPLDTDEIPTNVDISIYPNPVESDLLITLSEYIPAEGRVEIYDLLGQLVKTQSIYYGWNTVNVSTLVSGTYIYRVYDGAKVLGEGKVVKVGG